MSVYLTQPMLAAHVGTSFRTLNVEPAAVELALIEVRSGPASQRQEQWAAVFCGPAGLPQHTYRLEHPALGVVDLFLVPIAQDDRGMYYEAVFNRLLE